MHKRNRGDRAEELVVDWLEQKGVRILARNRTMRGGELDIVARLDNLLLVVEVKSIDSIDDIYSYMSTIKIKRLIHTTTHRMFRNSWVGPVRIDVVYVKGNEVVEWFQDITNK